MDFEECTAPSLLEKKLEDEAIGYFVYDLGREEAPLNLPPLGDLLTHKTIK